jgi:hypothetical protein
MFAAMAIAATATKQIKARQDSLLKLFLIEVPPLWDVVEMDGTGNENRRLTPWFRQDYPVNPFEFKRKTFNQLYMDLLSVV